MIKKLDRGASLTDQAVEFIRESITSGELVAGQTYSASYLGNLIGVSRTPVREALLQLARAGMIRIDANKGATILATTFDDLVEVFQIRLMLEVPAAGTVARHATDDVVAEVRGCFAKMQAAADKDDHEATLRADQEFHLCIIENTRNAKLVEVLDNLRNLVLTRDARSCQEVVDDHAAIVEAIAARDSAAAAAAMRQHITTTAKLLTAQVADSAQEQAPEALGEALRWPNDWN